MNGYKTYLGIAIAVAPTIAHLLGVKLTPEFMSQFPDAVDSIVTLVGGAIAIYGRLVAVVPGWFSKE